MTVLELTEQLHRTMARAGDIRVVIRDPQNSEYAVSVSAAIITNCDDETDVGRISTGSTRYFEGVLLIETSGDRPPGIRAP